MGGLGAGAAQRLGGIRPAHGGADREAVRPGIGDELADEGAADGAARSEDERDRPVGFCCHGFASSVIHDDPNDWVIIYVERHVKCQAEPTGETA